MQQTDKYKFNLIEKQDTFSPDPLNENMEKLEGALEEARAEAAALDQRLQVFEGKHLVIGRYAPAMGELTTVDLGFDPKAVLILAINNMNVGAILYPGYSGSDPGGRIIENGFSISGATSTGILNNHGAQYAYIALG